jgi:hypothetical protein
MLSVSLDCPYPSDEPWFFPGLATWQGSEPLLFEELFVSPDSIYYSDIYYVMFVLVIHLHLFISVSFYTSFASSTLVMGIYMVLIYRNYQKDLRQMCVKYILILHLRCVSKTRADMISVLGLSVVF